MAEKYVLVKRQLPSSRIFGVFVKWSTYQYVLYKERLEKRNGYGQEKYRESISQGMTLLELVQETFRKKVAITSSDLVATTKKPDYVNPLVGRETPLKKKEIDKFGEFYTEYLLQRKNK